MRYYSNILNAKNQAELEKYVHVAKDKLDFREGTVLWRFLKNQHRYCFAAIKCDSLIGFTASSSIN
jgi:hypothetical protein